VWRCVMWAAARARAATLTWEHSERALLGAYRAL
jgi:hypothetical protein